MTPAQIESAARWLDERYGLDALYLFGSRARGDARPDSDIDLAMLVRRQPDALDLATARAQLCQLLGGEVDVVLLDRVSPILAMQVLRSGRRIATRNPTRAAEVEARIPSQYADLKRARGSAEEGLVRRMLDG